MKEKEIPVNSCVRSLDRLSTSYSFPDLFCVYIFVFFLHAGITNFHLYLLFTIFHLFNLVYALSSSTLYPLPLIPGLFFSLWSHLSQYLFLLFHHIPHIHSRILMFASPLSPFLLPLAVLFISPLFVCLSSSFISHLHFSFLKFASPSPSIPLRFLLFDFPFLSSWPCSLLPPLHLPFPFSLITNPFRCFLPFPRVFSFLIFESISATFIPLPR